jgi:hypothetical protein
MSVGLENRLMRTITIKYADGHIQAFSDDVVIVSYSSMIENFLSIGLTTKRKSFHIDVRIIDEIEDSMEDTSG